MAICIFLPPSVWYLIQLLWVIEISTPPVGFLSREKQKLLNSLSSNMFQKKKLGNNKYDRNLNPYVQINVKIIF